VYSNALHTYETVNKQTMSGREIEAAVLTKAAIKLVECQKNWAAADQNGSLEEALKFNQRVWSILQAELLREDNPLPKDIRLNILKLSAFVDRRILETLAYPAPEKLNVVININNNLAAGLRGSSAR
jgi:flagellar protein FlaF